MEALTVSEILEATGGRLLAHFDEFAAITEVDTDSRTMHENSLFVPLVGENFDGHRYLEQALDKGALGCLTQNEVSDCRPDRFYIQVEDTMTALGNLARFYRNKFDIKVVGVTGSVGKTTTKDMVASVLSRKYSVLKTQGNFNNNIGVPKTLFQLEKGHEIAVVEMGMNHAGEIDYLTRIAQPDVAIITNIGDAHIENLGSRENTLQAKAEIFHGLKQDGIAVLNGDDPLLCKLDGRLIHPIVWCGEGENSSFRCKDIRETTGDCMALEAETPLGELKAKIHCLGRHLYHPALKAAAVGSHFGMTLEEITAGIEDFAPTKMRMDVIRCKNGITILNDTYNANPQSMRAAVDVLAKYSGSYRVAVLGDMFELGELGPVLHESVGNFVGHSGIDCLITVGELGGMIAQGARNVGMSEVYDRPDKEEAKVVLNQVLQPGTVFLCKASRGMRFEEIVDYLKRLTECEE
ncbi:MAG: UDP-N-acetylmuramoyl-tripeptide--D-alanyl-D-alanine ligase [Oscillospiraceae bacterium]|nr:UDP-N-acetylmuramoyl-tripeptide--D-alanyl-D-alanine ligase [Oscillospiraceae bacterium]